jgi:hypothetical protein
MSSADISMILQNAARGVTATASRPVLRIALLPGELLQVPRERRQMHVLSGTAWVSECGLDTVADCGSCVNFLRSRHPALVSGMRGRPVLFEIW